MAQAKNLTFEWEGKDAKGNKVKGQMEGPNAAWVKAQLRRKGTVPGRVKKKAESLFGKRKQKIETKDIAIFARQLATMLNAGVPLVQSLDIVGSGHENPSMRNLLTTIKGDIESGTNLSVALTHHPKYFDDLFCNLVAAGEQSGTLENLLDKLATYMEKSEALKAKIKKALFYPIAVLVVAFVVTSILLVFVIPQFQAMFDNFGGELPAFTQFVVEISEVFQEWWMVIFAAIGGTGFAFVQLRKRSQAFSDKIDELAVKMPIVGDVTQKAVVARFSRTLATMSTAGVPLVEALDSVSGTAGNAVYKRAIEQMRDDTSTGMQLQASMLGTGLFPNMVVQMTAIGEESGSLDGMLTKVADFYEAEVDNAVDAMTSMLEPIIMSFLGVVVGGLVIAMYLPVFEMGAVV